MARTIGVVGELQEHLTHDAKLVAKPTPVIEILLDEVDHWG
jgi:hypothetical protein